ncbi:Proline dehydrogenase 1, mitochondrial [Zancudomyces culisetae]|uniref:Proline dehydrogenase n=1 Tax=Zancudomyces culisetae TaxID=1213189 RepID=A0A1R1PGU3_ZANCU|nr:Proline dehydrogenase 1, mitochondrial [Zancudomyces culisetae]|eukprot:OMH80157.1 Proline dehydrogenase 1, mitochondrial [Zancudomyces culisetae]
MIQGIRKNHLPSKTNITWLLSVSRSYSGITGAKSVYGSCATSVAPSTVWNKQRAVNSVISRSYSQGQSADQTEIQQPTKEQVKYITETIKLNDKSYLKHATLGQLLRNSFVYSCCTIPWLVNNSLKLIEFTERIHLSWLSHWFIKRTFFKTFCAGENEREIVGSMKRLKGLGIKSILDYSVESDLKKDDDAGNGKAKSENEVIEEAKKAIDDLVQEYKKSIDMAAQQRDSFVAVKVTGLITPDSLYRLSTLYEPVLRKGYNDLVIKASNGSIKSVKDINGLEKIDLTQFKTGILEKLPGYSHNASSVDVQKIFSSIDKDGDGYIDFIDLMMGMGYSNKLVRNLFLAPPHSKSTSQAKKDDDSGIRPLDLEFYDNLTERLREITMYGIQKRTRIMADAEHSYFQPTIDQAVLEVCESVNKFTSTNGSNNFQVDPILYNTYQLYTKSGLYRLKTDYIRSVRQGWAFGVKIVRGAYMALENARALELGYETPINETLQATHDSYNGAIEFLLGKIAESKIKALQMVQSSNEASKVISVNNPAIFIASHNHNSIKLAIDRSQKLGLIIKHDFSDTDKKNKNVVADCSRTLGFGQLFGMQDGATSYLANYMLAAEIDATSGNSSQLPKAFPSAKSLHVYKYVPYGPIAKVLPYLIRRAQENSAVLDTVKDEVRQINNEIKSRLFFSS